MGGVPKGCEQGGGTQQSPVLTLNVSFPLVCLRTPLCMLAVSSSKAHG